MKNQFLIIFLLLLTQQLSAQNCTPNAAYLNSSAGLYPSQLPSGNTGQAYSTQLDIKTATDSSVTFQGIPVQLKVKAMKLLAVVGAPPGFSFTPTYNDVVNNVWQNGGSDPNWTPVQGCIAVSASIASVNTAATGGPLFDGVWPISVYIDAQGKGNPIPATYTWLSTLGTQPYGAAYKYDFVLVIQGGNVCTYNFQVPTTNFASNGGSGTILPNTQSNCTWTVSTNNPTMITGLPSNTVTGNSTINFSVTSCTGNPRTGNIVITDGNNVAQTFTISQTCTGQSCTYNFQVPNLNFANNGGTGTINPNTQTNCAWTVSTDNPTMITGLPSNTISGNTSINFGVSSCSGSPRTGNINIVDGNNVSQSFTISQTCTNQGNTPVANFFAAQTSYSGPCPVLIDFFDQSSNSPTQWVWEFLGNGINPSASTLENPTDISYSQSGIYTVKLTAYNANGSDDTVKVSYININCTVGLDEFVKDEINIYPNPATDKVFIKLNKKIQNCNIKVVDFSGKVVSDNTINDNKADLFELPLTNFSSGFYTIIISSTNYLIRKKIIVK
jgi:PKD repeat protein